MEKRNMPVPISLDLINEIDIIANQAFLSRTKIIDLILRQFITEPQYRRTLTITGSGPKTTYGRSLDAPIDPGVKEPPPIQETVQRGLIKDQQGAVAEMSSELTARGMETTKYIDPFPSSPVAVEKSIIIRHHDVPAEYEYKALLTKKGKLSTTYKEAVRKYYGDPDLTFNSVDTVKDCRNHVSQHLVALITRGLVKNTRPTIDEVEAHREKENWEQYINSNGEFSDNYVDALLEYFKDEPMDLNVDELNQVVDKHKHIETFLPKLKEKNIAI